MRTVGAGWALGLLFVVLAGCKPDPTLEAAPPPAKNARALPNASGKKPMMGALQSGGAAAPGSHQKTE